MRAGFSCENVGTGIPVFITMTIAVYKERYNIVILTIKNIHAQSQYIWAGLRCINQKKTIFIMAYDH